MQNYILTGAPGAGKTSVIHELERQCYTTVAEAATDVIAREQLKGNEKPWLQSSFIDLIVDEQIQRQKAAEAKQSGLVFYDRSPICTYALAVYLGFDASPKLKQAIQFLLDTNFYQKDVLFLENLGFIENTPARTISFDEAVKFEALHKNVYNQFGFRLVNIPVCSVLQRVRVINKLVK